MNWIELNSVCLPVCIVNWWWLLSWNEMNDEMFECCLLIVKMWNQPWLRPKFFFFLPIFQHCFVVCKENFNENEKFVFFFIITTTNQNAKKSNFFQQDFCFLIIKEMIKIRKWNQKKWTKNYYYYQYRNCCFFVRCFVVENFEMSKNNIIIIWQMWFSIRIDFLFFPFSFSLFCCCSVWFSWWWHICRNCLSLLPLFCFVFRFLFFVLLVFFRFWFWFLVFGFWLWFFGFFEWN